jgi:hypothetical protein
LAADRSTALLLGREHSSIGSSEFTNLPQSISYGRANLVQIGLHFAGWNSGIHVGFILRALTLRDHGAGQASLVRQLRLSDSQREG